MGLSSYVLRSSTADTEKHWTAVSEGGTFVQPRLHILSLSLHRAFRRVTLLAHQPMHTHKIVYIKTFKIASTCFDHAVIIRELHSYRRTTYTIVPILKVFNINNFMCVHWLAY